MLLLLLPDMTFSQHWPEKQPSLSPGIKNIHKITKVLWTCQTAAKRSLMHHFAAMVKLRVMSGLRGKWTFWSVAQLPVCSLLTPPDTRSRFLKRRLSRGDPDPDVIRGVKVAVIRPFDAPQMQQTCGENRGFRGGIIGNGGGG